MAQRLASPPGAWTQLARFSGYAALLFGVLYFPYRPDSWPARALFAYVALVARGAAWLLGRFDSSVQLTDQMVIRGQFPLQIVLDCTALDVQALYLAAVLGAPAGWRTKLAGACAGLAFLAAANLARIAILYGVGVYAPARFDLVHEDVMTFAMLACACLAFVVFSFDARAARPSFRTPPTAPPAAR